MILQLIRGILGDAGRPLLDFVLANPSLVTGFLAVWLAVFAAGRIQVRRIARKSEELVAEKAENLVRDKPHITSRGLYKRIYPEWSAAVRDWAWFVPHRLDLWPVPVTPETVQYKVPFSPEWISDVLRRHDIRLDEHDRDT
jgi:hypothetical protein